MNAVAPFLWLRSILVNELDKAELLAYGFASSFLLFLSLPLPVSTSLS